MEARLESPMHLELASPNLEAAIGLFPSISLGDMNSVSLMRRVDTKYVIHVAQLPALLTAVQDRYAILEIDRRRAMRYSSRYFDTVDHRFFNDHHNRRAKRAKVRIREYVNSGIGFLEIKQKTVKGVTEKRRMLFGEPGLTPEARRFIDETFDRRADRKVGGAPIRGCDLQPSIHNQFRRITLVDTGRCERVTIDWELSSHLHSAGCQHVNLVIVEVKQEGVDRHAPVMQALKSVGARPFTVSKYCLGMVCLCSGLKANRFKKKLLRIGKVTSVVPN